MTQPNSVLPNFSNFYESWINAQQSFVQRLSQSVALQDNGKGKEEDQVQLTNEVLAHYHRYYEELSKAASKDIFRVLAAPWLTSFERTLVWNADSKPSIVFRHLAVGVKTLTSLQGVRLNDVMVEVKQKEMELTDAMANVQRAVVALVARWSQWGERVVDGEMNKMEVSVEELRVRMLEIFYRGTWLREFTVIKVMEVLNSDQAVKFLATTGEYLLQMRRWGLQKDFNNTLRRSM